MHITRARIFAVATAAAVAATIGATTLAAAPASAATSRVVIVNCAGTGQVRPARYDIGCVANELLAGMRWTSWRSADAFGSGVLKIDNCKPNCARGRYLKYSVLLVAWRPRIWAKHGGTRYFTRMTWIFTGKRPRHAAAAQTITLPAQG